MKPQVTLKRPRIRWIANLALCGFLLSSVARPAIWAKEPPKADLSLKDVSGKRVHLRDLRGNTVVLNFWATWCGPCREEMPRLVEAEKQYQGRGVIFLGASLDEQNSLERVAGFVREQQIDFPIWVGATAEDLGRLDMGAAVPATAFIDQNGYIVARVSGEIRQTELEDRLRRLTEGKTIPVALARVVHLDAHN